MIRRTLLLGAIALAGCGAGTGAPSSAGVAVPAPTTLVVVSAWRIDDVALSPGSSVDLAASLPSGAIRGGVFEVSATGAQLPAGVTLSAVGLLSAANDASVSATTGVVFSYAEP